MIKFAVIVFLVACGGGAQRVGSPDPHAGSGDTAPAGDGGVPPDAGGDNEGCDGLHGDPLGPCTTIKPGLGGLGTRGRGRGGSKAQDDHDGSVAVDPSLEVAGALPKEMIHRVVRAHFSAIRYCYETTLMANPNIEGRLVAKFKIGLDGTVSDVSAMGVHPDLEACVAEKILKFRFPRPDGGDVEVTYPLTFKPG